MAAMTKRNPRSVSSIVRCEEKACCRTANAEATYKCADCRTHQCDACREELHRTGSEGSSHEVEKIEIDEELLCRLGKCPNKNYCDVRCITCSLSYCYDCDASYHSKAANASHRRESASDVPGGATTRKEQRINATAASSGGARQTVVVKPSTHATDSAAAARTTALRAEDAAALPTAASTATPAATSFMLINSREELQFTSPEHFAKTLCPDVTSTVKVVSIFGNTGDGKSYTLNNTFFGGAHVFATSPDASCCTVGAWVAYSPAHAALFIDTEGLLGITSENSNRRLRLLLKIFALSDIVIYRTTAGRLHADAFEFLGNASKAYRKFFLPELQAALKRSLTLDLTSAAATHAMQNLGPALVLFHETKHTSLLGSGSGDEPADAALRHLFGECDSSAFSSVKYVGTKTTGDKSTDFSQLCAVVVAELANASVRTARSPALVYSALEALNRRYNGDMSKPVPNCLPDQYFTCLESCVACSRRCRRTMNHHKDEVPHDAPGECKYVHTHDNKRYLCQKCYDKGELVWVSPQTTASNESGLFGLAKYALSGYVLECPKCGVIYRSRQYWYGNEEPTKEAVRTQLCHVWTGQQAPSSQVPPDNTAWKLLDGVRVVADTVTSVSAKPVRLIGSWAADQVAPDYWEPNSKILTCRKCEYVFKDADKKHHCRSCGKGFCDTCSSHRKSVPERGWGSDLVRVCDLCFESASPSLSTSGCEESSDADNKIVVRKTYENIATKLTAAAVAATDYAAEVIKDSARPAYWIPDSEIKECRVCQAVFGPKLLLHHCRSCGEGVCADCSPNALPVPHRGWEQPVRVCSICCTSPANSCAALNGSVY